MPKHSPCCRCTFCIPVYRVLMDIEEMQGRLDEAKSMGTRVESAHVAQALAYLRQAAKHLSESVDLF